MSFEFHLVLKAALTFKAVKVLISLVGDGLIVFINFLGTALIIPWYVFHVGSIVFKTSK